MKATLVVAGLAIFLSSLYSAFVLHFNHFYELMLLGLVCILLPATPEDVKSPRFIVYLYANFALAGFFIDYIVGQQLTGLWSYTYTTAFEYVLLYLWIYPAGGYVMLQSYLIGVRLTKAGVGRRDIPLRVFHFFCVVLLAAAAISWLCRDSVSYMTWVGALFFFGTLLLCAVVACISESRGGRSYFRDLFAEPATILPVTLAATYANLLVHELPNVYARQWTYLTDPHALLGATMLGVPLAVWFLWPLLLIGPVSLYYLAQTRISD